MQLSDRQHKAAVLLVGALFVFALAKLRFGGDFDLPGKPEQPQAEITSAQAVSKSIKRSTEAYNAYLAQDAATFGLAAPTARDMSAVFPYRADRERRVLEVGQTIEVLGLSLSLSVERKLKGSRRAHMILSIENKGHKPLAYHVQTRPSAGVRSCARMAHLPHNVLALPAGGMVKRSECVYRKGWSLEINMVETMTLPELGYLYLSSVQADRLGLDERTAERHVVPVDAMACRILQSATHRNALASGKVTWRDQVDFYARHRCKTYTFPVNYKAFQQDGEQILPVTEGDL